MFSLNISKFETPLDPLEQFDIVPLFWIYNTAIINNLVIYSLLIYLGIYVILTQAQYKISSPSNIALVNKNLFEFVKSIIKENVTKTAQKHFPLIYYIFIFLVFCNLIGMIPYSFTITSSFTVTLFLSLGFFIGVNIIGFLIHGTDILNLFLPGGAPLPIVPFLIVIEMISYFARIFSLSIRLFANMMSGHTLLKILIGFSWNMFKTKCKLLVPLALIPFFLVFIITGLELAIAFLQAYVFTVLICIYLNDVFAFH